MNRNSEHATIAIKVIGCGDAFSKALGSSAYLFWHMNTPDNAVLFDCGYQTPSSLFGTDGLHPRISTIVISHFHADHVFGLPVLLSYWVLREPRSAPLRIIGPKGIEPYVYSITEAAYPKTLEKRKFDIIFEEISKNHLADSFSFEFARTRHSIESYALKVNASGLCFAISGDGAMTEESLNLFQDVKLLIHEAFGLRGTNPTHEYLEPLLDMLDSSECLERLLITHMKEAEHESARSFLKDMAQRYRYSVSLLKPGEQYYL